ncbi:ISPg2, transposase, putative [Microscilla marina ATCC 23134]|uniref:ISPg2, transposase, putative n=2 Tax=Microscilla marina TaxID=1027 RepID=A1ZVQ9_MICM2|nr:ISPg2, transposase, putative [Microscilla marina ATCC 23134]
MVNTNSALCAFLDIPETTVVSRSHLPVLLQKVDVEVFDYLLFTHYGFRLDSQEKQWFSGDGKELRGSIESGKKRGQAVVQIVHHHSGEAIAQNYYDGQKESEIPTLRALLSKDDLASQKITLDALHLCPSTTEMITKAGGVFLIGLKENQPTLLAHMTDCALPPIDQKTTFDFNHGRVEQRKYWLYDVSKQGFDPRWDNTAFKRLVKVQRTRINQKNAKISREVSYYISNETAKEGIFDAVRNHWSVEVNNHIRDVTLNEDQLKSKKRQFK